MLNQAQNPKSKDKYDLEERTAKFGEEIIEFARTLPKNTTNNPFINQLLRAGTSIGANYMERQMLQNPKKTLDTRLQFAKRNQKRQCIG